MPKFNIEKNLYSLPENTTNIDISCKGLYELPDITRFTNLLYLNCDDNQLTSLPTLPESLVYLSCDRNKIRSLPTTLPANLQSLYCSCNQLTSLPPTLPVNLRELYITSNKLTSLPPTLPANLKHLYCDGNQLHSLPSALPANLQHLHCSHNVLTSMPKLPESINSFAYCFNPVWKIRKRINSFRYLYYSLKFKRQFKNWLWEKVRKPKIEKKYHPKYLMENLNEDVDLDSVLDHWVNIVV